MKVILCEDVEHLGSIGEEVNVAPGYARNYLFPRRLAVGLETGTAKQIEHELRIIRRREEARRKELTGVMGDLEKLTIEITARAGEEGKLFGSVTSLHVAQKLAELGHKVDRRKIRMKEPIKSLGVHTVPLQLMPGVEGKVKVTVIGEVVEQAAPDPELAEVEAAERAEEAAERGEAYEEAVAETPVSEAPESPTEEQPE